MRPILGFPSIACFAVLMAASSGWAQETPEATSSRSIIEPPAFAEPTHKVGMPGKIHSAPVSNADLKAQLTKVAPGWLRTYATSALPPDVSVAIPEYYETALESDMRASINEALERNGVEVVEDREGAPFRLRYSAQVNTPETSVKQSAYRIAPDADYRYNKTVEEQNEQGGGFRPALRLGSSETIKAKGPALRVSILVLDGEERIWSGFAEAELGEFRRSELVSILSHALMRHWGENAEIEHAQFSRGHAVARPTLE